MKTIVYIILSTILLLSVAYSCKKEPDTISPKDIAGQWKWLSTWAVYPPSATNPKTPQNTGIQELTVFNSNHTWFTTKNNIKTDSGTFSLGHGSYTPYPGAGTSIYDSIAYYRNGIKLNMGDYYDVYNDTLHFCPGYGGRFISYTLPNNGSKFWIRQ
jgi:hypothetical protein